MAMERSAGTADQAYSFNPALVEELDRLKLLEELLDPATRRVLDLLGISSGQRCLEVGGGMGSIALWLCTRVGETGSVVATDLDTRFLDSLQARNLQVRRHNIVSDDLEFEAFDLVHARLVLDHLPERRQVLARMVAALRPGGWLVLEGFDWVAGVPDPATPPTDAGLFVRVQSRMLALLVSRGADVEYGRRLLSQLRSESLEGIDVRVEGRVVQGGSPAAAWWRLTFEQLYQPLLQSGELLPQETERMAQLLSDPNFIFSFPLFISAWGQKPRS
jgi:SAM-dependent methyltransferase